MPSGPWSTAIALVSAITAPFEVEYGVRPRGRKADIDETLTMAPPPAVSFIAGIAWREAMNMLSTLTRMTCRHCSRATSVTLPGPLMPTLLSRQSSRPNCAITAPTIALACCSSVTSATKAVAVPPSCAIIATVRSARARSRSTTKTFAPARASRIAAARPLPIPSSAAPPPVTIATFPSSPSASRFFLSVIGGPPEHPLSGTRLKSGVAALLAPEPQLLLYRPVRVTEQHRLVLGLMAYRHPARRDKDVARLPAQDLLADPGFAAPFDRDIDRAVGRAVGAGREALRQQLNERADRRHRVVTARRVDEAHLVTVIGIGIVVPAQRLEPLPGPRVRVVENRRGLYLGLPVDGQQVVAEPRGAIAFGPRYCLYLRRGLLGEARAQQLDDLDVKPVEPNHRLRRFVTVIVPSPRRGDDKIARLHRSALAVDGGVGAMALDDEAQRRLRMTMGRRHLARQNQLQPGKQRAGDRGLPRQSRVFQDQDAALGLMSSNYPARLHQVSADFFITPQRRQALRGRLG